MDTLPKKAIVDTIEATEEYNARLDTLLQSAISAESQVQLTANNATIQVEAVFNELDSILTKTLAARKATLLALIDQLKKDSLTPLAKCKTEIINRQTASLTLIGDAKNVLKIGGFKSEDMFSDFIQKSSAIGSLPAVPEPELVPEITFQSNTNEFIAELTTAISSFGQVSKIGPVQISSVDPHPGSLLVRWDDIDTDSFLEGQVHRLQMATYNAWKLNPPESSIFHDIYTGPEMFYLVRDIRPYEKYCFRVSCKSSGTEWSAWSSVRISSTHLPPFQWDHTNTDYRISHENKLARPFKSNAILFSQCPQIKSGHSILFSLTKSCDLKENEGIALCVNNKLTELRESGSLFVSFLGEIFIDGKKKTINLPPMGNHETISFGCDVIKNKWRITIERGSKAVTYDWAVDTDALYFGTVLSNSDTLILVQ